MLIEVSVLAVLVILISVVALASEDPMPLLCAAVVLAIIAFVTALFGPVW